MRAGDNINLTPIIRKEAMIGGKTDRLWSILLLASPPEVSIAGNMVFLKSKPELEPKMVSGPLYGFLALRVNACWGTQQRWQPKWNVITKPLSFFSDPKWHQKFHLWRMEWNSQKILLSVDGILLNTIDLSHTINANNKGPKNPFHQPHYLLLNLAIGGQNGGDPTQTPFPCRYEIDFVRVYQKKS